MPYKLKKIIIQRDNSDADDLETHIHQLDSEIDSPYVAGKLQDLIPLELQHNEGWKLELSTPRLFNAAGLEKLVPEVGPKGIYYLELRPGYKLNQLMVDPDEVVVDIFIGPIDTLIYSFYNPTRRNSISITASIEKDTEGVYAQIKAEPNDLIWRQYFVKRAMLSSQGPISPPKKSEIIEKDILTSDEAAVYTRSSKKTLQNYASQGKLKSLKGGKFRRKDLDEFLEHKKKK